MYLIMGSQSSLSEEDDDLEDLDELPLELLDEPPFEPLDEPPFETLDPPPQPSRRGYSKMAKNMLLARTFLMNIKDDVARTKNSPDIPRRKPPRHNHNP